MKFYHFILILALIGCSSGSDGKILDVPEMKEKGMEELEVEGRRAFRNIRFGYAYNYRNSNCKYSFFFCISPILKRIQDLNY
jgi:hypothetical protein